MAHMYTSPLIHKALIWLIENNPNYEATHYGALTEAADLVEQLKEEIENIETNEQEII